MYRGIRAIIADNPSVGLRVSGYPQADGQAVGTFQVMIEILGGHGGAQLYAAIANTSEQGVSVFLRSLRVSSAPLLAAVRGLQAACWLWQRKAPDRTT